MHKINTNGRLFVVSAPSGAGKTTLVNALIEGSSLGCLVERVVTYTTRPPRPGETNHEAYHFISKQEFEEKIKQNFFLEWSNSYQDYYGSARDILEKLGKGKQYILILDRAGAQAVKRAYPQVELIWIVPPSLEVLKERLEKRGDSKESQLFRLERAAFELQQEEQEQLYEYTVINSSFNDALLELKQIVCCPKK